MPGVTLDQKFDQGNGGIISTISINKTDQSHIEVL